MNNWDPSGGPNNAYYASSTGLSPFFVSDEPDSHTQNCVTVDGLTPALTDHNCECSKFNFVCEELVEDNMQNCDQDLMPDDINLEEFCDGVYDEPQCTEECQGDGCKCLGDQHNNIVYEWVYSDGSYKEIRTVTNECLNWVEAQEYCCQRFGGRLWEPRSEPEWTAAWTALTGNVCAFETF